MSTLYVPPDSSDKKLSGIEICANVNAYIYLRQPHQNMSKEKNVVAYNM
jgi:hypothetical protein